MYIVLRDREEEYDNSNFQRTNRPVWLYRAKDGIRKSAR